MLFGSFRCSFHPGPVREHNEWTAGNNYVYHRLKAPLIGETTLLSQKVIELAGDAANGVKGHVGLTVDAPIPAIQEFGKKYEAKYHSKPDHNGVKGYIAPYMIKAAAEKAGKLDPKAIAAALHGMTITPDKTPGILIEATWDDTG